MTNKHMPADVSHEFGFTGVRKSHPERPTQFHRLSGTGLLNRRRFRPRRDRGRDIKTGSRKPNA